MKEINRLTSVLPAILTIINQLVFIKIIWNSDFIIAILFKIESTVANGYTANTSTKNCRSVVNYLSQFFHGQIWYQTRGNSLY